MKVIVALVFLSAVIATGYSSRSNNRFDDNRPIESYRLLDALEYTCTDILPLLDHLNYVNRFFGNTKTLVQPVCKYILQEADDFDPTKFCTFVTEYIRTLALLDPSRDFGSTSSSGQRRNDYDLVFELVANATRNLYGIDPNNATTICPNANKLFEPTLGTLYKDILTEYYTDLLTEVIPILKLLCHGRKYFYTAIGVPVDSPYEQLADSLLDIGSETAGYDDYADFCDGTKQWFSQDVTDRRKGARKIVLTVRERVFGAFGIEINSTKSIKPKEEL